MADKHNDGIEERAREFLVSVAVVGTGTLASFARTETATLTARVKELEEALGSLHEASRQYELFGLRYGMEFKTQRDADTYKRLSNRLGDAQTQAQKLLDR